MADGFADIHFPVAGVDVFGPFSEQRPRQLPEGEDDDGAAYGRTCAVGRNVRVMVASTYRRTGGSRPGMVKYIASAPVEGWLIQSLSRIVVTKNDALA